MESSQVTFIYIALFTIQIVSKQLHSDNMKIIQHRSIKLLNIKCPQLSKPKAKVTVARNQNSHQVIEWRKKPWENPGSVGGQFSSGQRRNSVYKTNWIETLRICPFPSVFCHGGTEN